MGVAESDVFLALVTKYYLEDIRKHDARVIAQIEQAKALNKPVILAICTELTEQERQEAETIFKNHNVIGRVYFERDKPETITQSAIQAKQIAEKWLRERNRISE
ncbi:MAG: hypothetical protein QXO67_02230 [Candidatus Bathyarchaeia archaeon]